jgi:hypothetical protein
MRRKVSSSIVLSLLLGIPGAAAAAPTPASVTIAGGVSLGAYEAGLAYYSLETLRANPGVTDLKMAAGASAGSVNSLISLLQSCGAPSLDPQQSLFWKTWIPLGLDQLTPPGNTPPTAAFSRSAFETPLARIADAWKAGLRADCDVVFGVAVTRLEPRQISLKGERLLLPRVEEHFVVRIQGRGPGKPPRLTNYADPKWEGDQALLPEQKDGEVPFPALIDAIYASTAFPGAFPPQPVKHCIVNGGSGPWPGCPESAVRTDFFVDGGVFDNTPVRLSKQIAAAGMRITDGTGRWLDKPDLDKTDSAPGMVFTYISTDVRTFPAADRAAASTLPVSILGVATLVGSSFYDSARAKNLLFVHDEDPEFFDKLNIPERHLPAASSPLGAFFGFFETGLREFDFALGMYDGNRLAKERLGKRLARAGATGKVAVPEDQPGAAAAGESWKPYRCLSAVMDAPAAAEAACRDGSLRNFRVLLQASIERLWDRCASLDVLQGVFAEDPLCRAAADAKPPLQVPGVTPLPGNEWRRGKGESEAAYTMRLLASHGYEFKDLGLTAEQADEAPARLRKKLLAVGRQISKTQPGSQSTVIDTAVKLAADSVIYVPPQYTGWAVFGRDLEVGANGGFLVKGAKIGSVRLHGAFQLNNTARVLSSENGSIAFTLLGGVEVVPPSLGTSAFQPGFILRGGYMAASEDKGGFETCPDPTSEVIGSCSRPTVGLGVAATALEMIRVQLFFNYFIPVHNGNVGWWAIAPQIGIQWAF